LAAVENAMPSENIWNAAILDENWQSSAWGEDQEQKKNLELKKVDFFKAIEVLSALA
jgi:chaperone required for assembly of F1-ATPase